MSDSEMKAIWKALGVLQSRIENLEQFAGCTTTRLEKLEMYMDMEDRITASSVLLRLTELEDGNVIFRNQFSTIWEKLDYLEKMEMNNRENIFANRNNPESFAVRDSRIENSPTPHKCPICQGSSMVFVQLHPMSNVGPGSKFKVDAMGRTYMECETCDGKGIVWG